MASSSNPSSSQMTKPDAEPSAIERAQAAVISAERRVSAVASEVDEEIRVATSAIRATYKGRTDAAKAALFEAQAALRDAKDATPDHPWTGKRVFRIERVLERWSQKLVREVRHEGVVETRRSHTEFAANKRWGLPAVGEGFVRLLKKDGSPGLGFEALESWRDAWKLDEAAEPDPKAGTTDPLS